MAIANTDGNIVIGTSVDTAGINEGMAKIKNQMSSLSKIAVFGFLGKQLIGLGKSAAMAASDLAEVNNVVFTGFGGKEGYDMVNKFCNTCIEKFGLTEFAAKNMAGSFASMGRALGLQQKNANNMALNLTALAGDMASFYNISEDYARVALSAVYTGETETLKRYGIVLTDANLQQYALTKGIAQNYRTLDSASKAYIRYMYIMEQTGAVEGKGIQIQGDFARTHLSFANSLRILEQEWNNLEIAMGGFIKTVAAPIIQGLTAIVRAFVRAFQVLYNTLHSIFGFTIDWGDKFNKDFSKTSNTIGGASSSASDLGNNLNKAGGGASNLGSKLGKAGGSATKATKKIKKLNKSLQGFDKLNNLTTTETGGSKGYKGGGGGGAGGLGGVGGIDIPDIPLNMKLSGKKKKLPKFEDMFHYGRWLSNGITESLNKIPWGKIQKKSKAFAFNFAQLLNGLTTPKMFKAFGHTLAQGLNTAIGTAETFLNTYDFKELGKSLGKGINQFFKEFDFEQFGRTVGKWAEDMCDFIETTLATIDWGLVFKKVGEFFKGLGWKGVWNLLKLGILKGAIKEAFEMLLGGAGLGKSFLSGKWLPNLLSKAKLGDKIKKGLKGVFYKEIKDEETGEIVKKGLFPKIGRALKQKLPDDGFKGLGKHLKEKLTSIFKKTKVKAEPDIDFSDIDDGTGAFSAYGEAVDEAKKRQQELADSVSDIGDEVNKTSKGPLSNLKQKLVDIGNTVKTKLSGLFGGKKNKVDLDTQALDDYTDKVEEAKQRQSELMDYLDDTNDDLDNINTSVDNLGNTKGIDKLKGAFSNLKTSVVDTLGKVKELMTTDVSTMWNSGAAGKAGVVGAGIGAELGGWELGNRIGHAVAKSNGDDEMADLYDKYDGLEGQIQLWIDLVGSIKDDWELNVIPAISNWWSGMGDFFKGLGKDIGVAWKDVKKTWGNVSKWFSSHVIKPLVRSFKNLVTNIRNAFSDARNNVQKIWQTVANWFNAHVIKPIQKFFKNLGTNIKNIFTNARNNVQKVWKTVSGWFNNHVIKPVEKFFGNLGKNIRNTFNNARNTVIKIWKGVSGWFSKHVTGPIRNAFSSMGKGIQGVFNGIRNTFRSIVNGIIGGMNTLIRGLNHVKVKIPKGVPKLGGKSFGFNIPEIPRLAQGAVIPPNKQFLAMLGDQKHGTNIETPLSTMVEAFNTALKQNGGAGNNELMSQMIMAMNEQTKLLQTIANKNLSIGDRDIFNSVKRSAYDYSMRTGKKAF